MQNPFKIFTLKIFRLYGKSKLSPRNIHKVSWFLSSAFPQTRVITKISYAYSYWIITITHYCVCVCWGRGVGDKPSNSESVRCHWKYWQRSLSPILSRNHFRWMWTGPCELCVLNNRLSMLISQMGSLLRVPSDKWVTINNNT